MLYILLKIVPQPSMYHPAERMWIWTYSENGIEQPFQLKIGDVINFKVKTIKFTTLDESIKGKTATTVDIKENEAKDDNIIPIPRISFFYLYLCKLMMKSRSSSIDIQANQLDRIRSIDLNDTNDVVPQSLMITGTIEEDGLGAVSWW